MSGDRAPGDPTADDTDDAASALPDVHEGDALLTVSWWGSSLFTALAVAAMVVDALGVPFAVVSVVLFLLGVLAFARAYLIAVQRSREVLIGMGGLAFLLGCAPSRVRRSAMGAFTVQLVMAFVAAGVGLGGSSTEITNPLAFGLFAPMFGLGLAALWGAHYGVFPPRPAPPSRGRDRTR